MSKRIYPQLDLMKFCMAILVLQIHTEPISIVRGSFVHELYDAVLRLAVPFFFLTSGFLLGSRCRGESKTVVTENLRKSITHNVRLYLLWSLIYLPAAIVGYVQEGVGLVDGVLRYVVSLFLVGEHFYSWPLWYLLAMIYALMGMGILRRFVGSKGVCAFSLIIFFLAHVINGVYEGTTATGIVNVLLGHMFEPLIVGGPARILIGIFYISFGWLLAERPTERVPSTICLLVMIGTLLLSAWLRWWPVTLLNHLCFFILVINMKVAVSPQTALKLRRSSTVLYFTHMLFFFVWYLLNDLQEIKGIAGCIWTLVWSLVACVVVLQTEKHERDNRVTKFLF